MGLYRFVVRLPSTTGLPRDQFMNVWWFEDTVAGSLISGALQDFYVTRPSGSINSVATYFSQQIASGTNVASIDQYAIPSGDPTVDSGPPLSTIHFNWPSIAVGSALPAEVSIVLAMHGDLAGTPEHAGSSRPRARLRGRIFLGPLNTTAIELTSTNPKIVHVTPQCQSDIANAAHVLTTAVGHGILQVASRVNRDSVAVTGGWVDDAPDTQRRRGQEPTGRTNWVAA